MARGVKQGNMLCIRVGFDHATFTQLNEYADARGISVAEAVRRMVARGCAAINIDAHRVKEAK